MIQNDEWRMIVVIETFSDGADLKDKLAAYIDES